MWKIWEKWKRDNLAYFFPWLIVVVWSWKKILKMEGKGERVVFLLYLCISVFGLFLWLLRVGLRHLLRKVGHDVDIWARPISAQKVPESVLVYWTRDLLGLLPTIFPPTFISLIFFLLIFSIKKFTCVKKVYITNKLYMSL
jgi:hypothetical protein